MTISTKMIVAALVVASANAPAQDSKVIAQPSDKVRDFYSVPLDLTLWDLEKLKYSSELGWEMGEGEVYPTAKIKVNRRITLKASFGSNGELYMLETSSPGAVGPRRIAVGSSLAEVRRAWPSGRVLWGMEHSQFVTFSTGASIYYQFSPKDLPTEAWIRPRKDIDFDPAMKVIAIRFAALDKDQ